MVSNKMLLNALMRVAGLTVLGLSGTAFAGGDFVSAPAVNTAENVKEGSAGFYITGRAGYANNNWNHIKEEVNSLKRKKSTGGVNVGYAFNQFFAVEVGYTYLPKTSWNEYQKSFDDGIFVEDIWRVGQIKNSAFDLAGKISVPVPGMENVGLFAKAGVAKLRSSIVAHEYETVRINTPYNTFERQEAEHTLQKLSNTTLTYGFGAYWDITSNIRLDAGYQTWRGRHENVRSNKLSQPNMDAYTVGLTFFVDGLFNS